MTLRMFATVVSVAILAAGLVVRRANAQVFTDTFSSASFTVPDPYFGYNLAGSGIDTFGNLIETFDDFTGPAVSAQGIITVPMDISFGVYNPGPGFVLIVYGTGELTIANGVASTILNPGFSVYQSLPGYLVEGFDFTFAGTPTPTVTGTTTTAGGIPVTTGTLNSFSTGGFTFIDGLIVPDGTGNGVLHLSIVPVPEPGVCALLGSLGLTSAAFLRRRRARSSV